MNRGHVAAFAAIILLTCAAVQGGAADRVPASSSRIPDSPFLSVLLQRSAQGSRDLLGLPVAPSFPGREIARLADRLRPEIGAATEGNQVVEAFRRVLFIEEGFTYDKAAGDPENYLLESVLMKKRGNCLGLSMLFLALSDRLGLPMRGVYVPSHCFVRFEEKGVRRNIEMSDGGAPWGDERYRQVFRIRPGRPYLASLESGEMLGVYLKSLGAGYSRKGREEEALRLYEEAARFNPGLPDAYYNAGVSLQKTGRLVEAEASYRRALALDPDMAAARDNLSVLLAREGRFEEALREARRAVELEPTNAGTRGNLAAAYCGCGRIDEGIREYLAALEIDPGNKIARSGIAAAYYSRGSYREAITACDQAKAIGCRIDPSILEALDRYRHDLSARAKP